ncbi:hypothetical protein ACVWWG_003227 [Bradyrhizobium sp. LB7.2]
MSTSCAIGDAGAGDGLGWRHHHAAFVAARDHAKLDVVAQLLERGVEVGRFVERVQLRLVGKDDVGGAVAHQAQELVAIATDAEGIRQRERDLAAGLVRNLGRLDEGLLGPRRIPEITLEINDAGAGDLGRVDVGRRQILRRAEIGVHGALAVARDQDVGAAGGGAVFRGGRVEGDAGRADIVDVELADLVVLDLADIGGARPQAADADDGVGSRAARNFRRRSHVVVDGGGPRLVDQGHAALGHAVLAQKGFIGLDQHVEQRVADAENVIFHVSHSP